jgi:predicted dehydrogenase
MAGERLRVGMLGVGAVAAKYVKLFAEYPRSRLVAVYDVSPGAAQAAAGATGARILPSEAALLAEEIDAVVISTPNFLHAQQTIAALQAGKHVLLQKPMTLTAAEAARLAQAAAQSGRRLGIYMNSLDNRIFHDVKAMIRSGTLGRIGAINAKLANGTASRWKSGGTVVWRQSRSAVGGGSFAMLAYHYINLCQWLLDEPIINVMARGKNLMSPHIEGDDIMSSLVEFRDGAMGTLESAWCVTGEQFSIHGSEGSLAYIDNLQISMKAAQPFEGEAISYTTPGKRVMIDARPAPAMDDWHNPHNQHRRFIDAILDRAPIPVSPEQGVQDMRVLEAAYRSSVSGRIEEV